MPEDGDSDGGHDDENDDDDCNGDSILVDDDRYSLLMLKLCEREQFFWDIWPLTCKWKTYELLVL